MERKQDLAVYYLMSDLFSDTDYITVVDGFPVQDLVIPTVAVEAKTIDTNAFQLGSHDRIRFRMFFIDVFGKNKSQRDEMGYKILSELENDIPVYDYDEGFPPTVLTQIGCLKIQDIRMEIIKVLPEFVEKLYYRATVSFTAAYNSI